MSVLSRSSICGSIDRISLLSIIISYLLRWRGYAGCFIYFGFCCARRSGQSGESFSRLGGVDVGMY